MNKKLRLELVTILLCFISYPIFSQSTEVKNVKFIPRGDEIDILYELVGDPQEEYEIEVFLKVEGDDEFEVTLEHLRGDYGTGKYVGSERKIIWEYLKQFPMGLEGEYYYFLITADKLGGGIPWYYFVGAAALGGAAAVLLSGGKSNGGTNGATYAKPPGRP